MVDLNCYNIAEEYLIKKYGKNEPTTLTDILIKKLLEEYYSSKLIQEELYELLIKIGITM